MMNADSEAGDGVLSAFACDENLRAARANRVFRTDEKRIRAENTVMNKSNNAPGLGFIQDRRLRADVLFIRAQSAIRADGFSSAQHRNSAIAEGAIPGATHGDMKCARTARSMLHNFR
jgi:hypothetical protein